MTIKQKNLDKTNNIKRGAKKPASTWKRAVCAAGISLLATAPMVNAQEADTQDTGSVCERTVITNEDADGEINTVTILNRCTVHVGDDIIRNDTVGERENSICMRVAEINNEGIKVRLEIEAVIYREENGVITVTMDVVDENASEDGTWSIPYGETFEFRGRILRVERGTEPGTAIVTDEND